LNDLDLSGEQSSCSSTDNNSRTSLFDINDSLLSVEIETDLRNEELKSDEMEDVENMEFLNL